MDAQRPAAFEFAGGYWPATTPTAIEYTDRNGVTVEMPSHYTPEYCRGLIHSEWVEEQKHFQKLLFLKWLYDNGRVHQ